MLKVVNLVRERFFFYLHPLPPAPVKSLFGDSFESFQAVASPQMARQALVTFFCHCACRYAQEIVFYGVALRHTLKKRE